MKAKFNTDNTATAAKWRRMCANRGRGSGVKYTERKDGKDNEIYDGDILQDDDDLKYVVFWNEMYMEWAYRRIDTGQTFAFAMSAQALRHFTVVGNIHDNPEMLTAKTMQL